jgi:hypothetical protein
MARTRKVAAIQTSRPYGCRGQVELVEQEGDVEARITLPSSPLALRTARSGTFTAIAVVTGNYPFALRVLLYPAAPVGRLSL